jgi:glycine/D-amino acid oxidase-like deaminating enzyme
MLSLLLTLVDRFAVLRSNEMHCDGAICSALVTHAVVRLGPRKRITVFAAQLQSCTGRLCTWRTEFNSAEMRVLCAGSSRQDCPVEAARDHTPEDIMQHAATFLPTANLPASAGIRTVRAGARPASARGRPYVGAMPGCDRLVIAAGHEGSGLTMAMSTAELVASALKLEDAHPLADAFTW